MALQVQSVVWKAFTLILCAMNVTSFGQSQHLHRRYI